MYHTMAAFALFSIIATSTPGPNNMMLLHSGAYFGWLRTVPHLLGIRLGIALLFLSIGLGLANIFVRYPTVAVIFKTAAIGYLVYLSFRIITCKFAPDDGTNPQKPMTFWQAAFFQWINPKPWAVISASVTLYSEAFASLQSTLMMDAIFSVSGLIGTSLWASSGMFLRRFLSNTTRFVWFNRAMGTLLIVSVLPMLIR